MLWAVKIFMANGKPKWTKCGHRSLKHNSYPKMVVRFGKNGTGPGKAKLLISVPEFEANEERAGKKPAETLATLITEASARWAQLREDEKRQEEAVF